MNGDLISRSALHRMISLDTKHGTYGEFMDGSEVSYTSREVHTMISEAPAVDAVEVVRCRDCKEGRKSDHAFAVDTAKPLCECPFMTYPHQWHEYCSWGERRADE